MSIRLKLAKDKGARVTGGEGGFGVLSLAGKSPMKFSFHHKFVSSTALSLGVSSLHWEEPWLASYTGEVTIRSPTAGQPVPNKSMMGLKSKRTLNSRKTKWIPTFPLRFPGENSFQYLCRDASAVSQ